MNRAADDENHGRPVSSFGGEPCATICTANRIENDSTEHRDRIDEPIRRERRRCDRIADEAGRQRGRNVAECHRRVWFEKNLLRISAHPRKYHEFRHFPSGRNCMKNLRVAILALAIPVDTRRPATPAGWPTGESDHNGVLRPHYGPPSQPRPGVRFHSGVRSSATSRHPRNSRSATSPSTWRADSYFFCNNFGSMKATRAQTDSATADSVRAKWPKEQLVTKLKESFEFCAEALKQLDDAKLAEQIAVSPTRNVPRATMVLGHAMDIGDHYSQLANYMRLNNIVPPTALPRPGRGWATERRCRSAVAARAA